MTVVKDEGKVLSKATPITIGLMIALLVIAFSCGITYNNVTHNSKVIAEIQKGSKITSQLVLELAQQNKYTEKRLERLEKK